MSTFATTPSTPTLPTCDTTVPPGNHTMAAFQTVLDQAVAAGDGGDGTIAVCLEDGVIVEQGHPEQVLKNPVEERTRQFLHKVTQHLA